MTGILTRLANLEKAARIQNSISKLDRDWDILAEYREALLAAAPALIAVASAAASLLSEDGALEAVSHFNAAFILRDAIAALEELK